MPSALQSHLLRSMPAAVLDSRMQSSPSDADADADAEENPVSPRSDTLFSPLIYAELKALAARAMRGERECHTLQTTALVNEAWMRVVEQHAMDPASRAQYLCVAAQMMRRVLVDHARRRMASKRPSSNERLAAC